MKITLALFLALNPLSSVLAQDSSGRLRIPPKNVSSGVNGSESGKSLNVTDSVGKTDSVPGGGSGDSARRRIPQGVREIPTAQRPNAETLSSIRERRGEPDHYPTQGPKGEVLGHAVRRDSLPPSAETGSLSSLGDPNALHRDERERGRNYWHSYRGTYYSHYIDVYGDDWYIWQYGSGLYSMRYYDGRWWRYDGSYQRWSYLHDNSWYYHDNARDYVYDEGRQRYEHSDQPLIPPGVVMTFHVGPFSPDSLSSRGNSDVLRNNAGFLKFDETELNNYFVGGEIAKGVGKHFELGVIVDYYNAKANSNYADYVYSDGKEIKQELSQSMATVIATAKVFPFGRDEKLQPYIGAGYGLNKWKYQEKGAFIDFNTEGNPVYDATYQASGVAAVPVLIGGLRVPLNNNIMLGVEYRRQWSQGSLPSEDGFAGDSINLGGDSVRAGVTINLDPK